MKERLAKKRPSPKTTLRDKVRLLRSAFASFVGRDKEGTYLPRFVRAALAASSEKPSSTFNGKDDFLQQLEDL